MVALSPVVERVSALPATTAAPLFDGAHPTLSHAVALLLYELSGLQLSVVQRLLIVGLLLSTALGVATSSRTGIQISVLVWIASSLALGNGFIIVTILLGGGWPVRALFFSLSVTMILPLGFAVGYAVGLGLAVRLGNDTAENIREQTELMRGALLELALESSLWRVVHCDYAKMEIRRGWAHRGAELWC